MLSTRSHRESAASGMRSPEKPGSIPFVKSVVPPSLQAASSAPGQFGAGARRMNEVHHRRGDDVLAGSQQPGDLRHRLTRPRLADGGVDDAVRRRGEQKVRVVRRFDSGANRQTGQLSGVTSDLLVGCGRTRRPARTADPRRAIATRASRPRRLPTGSLCSANFSRRSDPPFLAITSIQNTPGRQ